MAIQFAQAEYQSTNYYVLILLTDGQIDDFADTVDKIIEASSLPLSIVIVGLGDGDFTQIEKFDQDG
jgi:vacuolar-type H+-ATPase subunit F/Vma7